MATLLLGIHANICVKLNLFSMASDSLRRGNELAEKNGELMFLAELYRLKGELSLQEKEPDVINAIEWFRRAIQLSRDQGAKLWELRATVSLARLLATEGKREEARKPLSDIFGWFTQRLDTPDLKDAKALLDELRR